jgi:hypothetical protein
MTEEEQAVLRQTLIKESIGLLAVLAVVWYMGPGRMLIGGLRRRVEIWQEARNPDENVIRQFRTEVSNWDHEQAAKKDHRAKPERGCGCG